MIAKNRKYFQIAAWAAFSFIAAVAVFNALSAPGKNTTTINNNNNVVNNPDATFIISAQACNSTGLYVKFSGLGSEVDLINASLSNINGISNNQNDTSTFSSASIREGVNSTATFKPISTGKSVCGSTLYAPYNLTVCVSGLAPTITGNKIHTYCGLISGFST